MQNRKGGLGVEVSTDPRALKPALKPKKRLLKKMVSAYQLYILVFPTALYFLIFQYGPLYGLQIAFKDYSPVKGFLSSPWVGMEHFERFFSSYQFWRVLKNTLLLSAYELLLYPIPVIMALMLNQMIYPKYKRFVQTLTYAPHFISVVVVVGMLQLFLSPQGGIVNNLLSLLGMEPVFFFAEPSWFMSIFVWSGIWQNLGWAMIIYLAALTSINPELHEAAMVDGASKLKRIAHIDLPGIMPVVVIIFILNIGQFMQIGYEKVYLMQNPLNVSSSEIIQTYVYKQGLLQAQFSFATAIGLFNNIINCLLLISFNRIARKTGQASLW